MMALLQQAGTLPLLGAVALLGMTVLLVRVIFRRWVAPLSAIAEDARLIAMSNPRHRAPAGGAAEVRELTGAVNLLAERFQGLHADVEARIREANALLEEEKNTLAALMSKLTQGVLVCNPEGRILLYNPRAQQLLEGQARRSGAGDWIGLGRSVFGIIESELIKHALNSIEHRLAAGDGNLLVPFVTSRPGGRMLSTHLVPILDHERGLRGYILTFEDVTSRFGAESRRGNLLQSLTEGQRSAIGGIRAAIETVLTFPEMDESGRQQFFEVIRDEALKVSQHLDQLEGDYRQELKVQLPVEEVLGSDLLAAVERGLLDRRGRTIELSAPVEPVWLRIESYAVIQCMLFLIDQVTDFCRAEDLALTLAFKRSLASLELQWTGAALHMEALRRWGMRNISNDGGGASRTLFDTIEQHGGAAWPDRDAITGRPCLRVILPVSETQDPAITGTADNDWGHDFDFHLFETRGEARDWANLPLDRLTVTVVDTETTGLDPDQGDEIIAIGAVRVVNGRILRQESFDSFVRPQRTISDSARAIHGITQEMLRAEPPIEDVLPRLQRFVEDTVIVGHNVAFDMRFFAAAGPRCGVVFANPVLDTLLLECEINVNQQDKSLEGIAQRLGLSVTGRHTALGDALTTAEIFIALIPLLSQRGIGTLGEALRACQSSPFARLTG
ncbi:MAG: PAS domain-containing protein [Rhodospirillales bacterium]|nr:PAS domain-containing protein [Rhodospirillales bacterium]